MSAGYCHSLALRQNGSLVAWGLNISGECDVPAGNDFVAIAAGGVHSLALKYDGSIVAWGLGQSNVPSGNDFIMIAPGCGYSYHNLAIKWDRSIVAWGTNVYGECNVPDGNDFVAVAVGEFHSLALQSNGSLVTWGVNWHEPSNIPTGSDYVSIACECTRGIGLTRDGSLRAGGPPFAEDDIPGGSSFVAVSAGVEHGLALENSGMIRAWGLDYGAPPSRKVVSVSAGYCHSLALTPGNPLSGVPQYEWRRGCAPTSAAMMVAFWDQKYPNMWEGTVSMTYNDPNNEFHPVNKVIDHLGDLMNTNPISGWTYDSWVPPALMDYATERGYSFHAQNVSVDNNQFSFEFLKREVDQGRPMHLGLKCNQLDPVKENRWGHSVVAYGYQDNLGTNDDWIAVWDTWADATTFQPHNSNGVGGIIAKVENGIEWWKWTTNKMNDYYINRGTWFAPAELHTQPILAGSLFENQEEFEEGFVVTSGTGGGASLVDLAMNPEETSLRIIADGALGIDDCVVSTKTPTQNLIELNFSYAFQTSGTLQIFIDDVMLAELIESTGIGEVDDIDDFNNFSQKYDFLSYGISDSEYHTLHFSLLAEGGITHVLYLDNLSLSDPMYIPEMRADFDEDGDVDGADFLVWQRGETLNPLSQSDFADWQANFGNIANPISSASTAIPEPGASLILILTMAVLFLYRRTGILKLKV